MKNSKYLFLDLQKGRLTSMVRSLRTPEEALVTGIQNMHFWEMSGSETWQLLWQSVA